MIGQTISHYKILEKLGEGGMGVVYKATDTQLDRPVALKFLSSQFTSTQEERERFIREAKAASVLDHPNICTVHEAGQSDDGQMFMAMAYYEGLSLKQKIEEGKIPVEEALNIAIQGAEALKAADSKSIVHRDVKPGNIIITADGVAKLLDFGLASQANWATLTRSNSTIGTAAYMAPEQATGEGADHRSDLWSLGVVMYEMISGRLPFRGEHEAALMYSIVNEQPQDITEHVPNIQPEIVHVILRLLEKDPDDRYQKASEVLGELRRLQHKSGKTATHARTYVRSRGMKAWSRKWGTPALLIICTVVLAVAAYLFTKTGSGTRIASYRYTPFIPDKEAGYGKWSPDGKMIAYLNLGLGEQGIMIRSVGSSRSTQVASVQGDWADWELLHLSWGPDGKYLYFLQDSFLKRVSIVGGDPGTVLRYPVYEAEISPDLSSMLVLTYRRLIEGEHEKTSTSAPPVTLQRALLINPEQNDSVGLFIVGPAGELIRQYRNDPIRESTVDRTSCPVIAFSPDGSKIGLWYRATNGSHFWILPWPDGPDAEPRRIFANVKFGWPFYFEWLPDSRHIVLSHQRAIWVGDTEDETLERISASARNEIMRSVSRDGKRILFDPMELALDIVELPLNGGQPRSVKESIEDEYSATVSADGSSMTYITKQSGGLEIWYEEGGNAPRPIVVPENLGVSDSLYFRRAKISPDGKRVAYTWKRSWEEPYQLLSVSNVEGGSPFSPLPDSAISVWRFCWSPDSKRLFAEVEWANGVISGSLIPIGAGEIVNLPDSAFSTTDPAWSPDGRWIALGQRLGGSARRILLISPDGKQARALESPAPILGWYYSLVWSRDSRMIYVASSTSDMPRLDVVNIGTGVSRNITTYPDLLHFGPPNANATGSLSRDGSGILVTAMIPRSGIYILDGALR